MTIRNQANFTQRDTVEPVEKVPHKISSLNERLSKFLNDRAISGDVINAILQREDVDKESLYAADRTIQLSEEEAEYIVKYFPPHHPAYEILDQEFASDIQNIELAAKLSDYISTNFEFEDDRVADILDLEIYDEDNNIKLSPDQVANITGKQWLDFRTWTYDQKAEIEAERKAERKVEIEAERKAEEEIEGFDKVFGNDEIVQEKIKLNNLVTKLSYFVNVVLDRNKDKVADILGIDWKEVKINFSEQQVVNITGRQWQDLKNLTDTSKESFDSLFTDEEIVQEKIRALGGDDTLQASETERQYHREAINKLNTEITSDILKLIQEERKAGLGDAKKWNPDKWNLQKKLGEVLDSLDEDYLRANRARLTQDIAHALNKSAGKSSFFNFLQNKKTFTINSKKLDEYITILIPSLNKQSDQFVANTLNNNIYNHEVTELKLADRLTEFLTTTPSSTNPQLAQKLSEFLFTTTGKEKFYTPVTSDKTKHFTVEQLTAIRKLNPTRFDRILFPKQELAELKKKNAEERAEINEKAMNYAVKGSSTRSSEAWAATIIKNSWDQAVIPTDDGTQEGKQKVEIIAGKKTFNKLHQVLTSFDPQYLQQNIDKMIYNVSAYFINYSEKKGDRFILSADSIKEVAKLIERDYGKKNAQYIQHEHAQQLDAIKEKMIAHAIPESELKKRILSFLTFENIEEVASKRKILPQQQMQDFQKLSKDLKNSIYHQLQDKLKDKKYRLTNEQQIELRSKIKIFDEQQLTEILQDKKYYLTPEQQKEISGVIKESMLKGVQEKYHLTKYLTEQLQAQLKDKKYHLTNEQQIELRSKLKIFDALQLTEILQDPQYHLTFEQQKEISGVIQKSMRQEVQEKKYHLTNDQLAELRKLNPALFDSKIFLESDITNIENERKEIKEKILANFDLKEVSVHGTKMQVLNGPWDIVNSQDPRVQKIEAKHAANKVLHKVHTPGDDQESISSASSLRASLSDRIEEELIKPQAATISPRHSISSDSSGYNSDSDHETDPQSIRAASQDRAPTASQISESVSNRNSVSVDYNSNNDQRDKSIERSISVDSGLEESELNSRAFSDSEYEHQSLTAATSIESGLELGSQERLQEQQDSKSANIRPVLPSNLRDSDSAYGSQEDLAKEQNDPISKRVQDELRDIEQLIHRLYTYKTTQSQRVQKEIRPLVYHESALSVLEGLGGDLLRNHASDNKINELLKELKDNTAAAKSLMTAPEEKQKADYLLSRLEANLKGFILPHLPDASIGAQIFKEVLLQVQGQNIPKEQYASTVIGRAQELWEKEANSRIQEATSNRNTVLPLTDPLTEFKEIIRQADQTEKMAKHSSLFNDKHRTELASAANKVLESFIKELPFNKAGVLSPEIKNSAKMFIFKANIPEEDLLKVQACIEMIDMPDGLLYALFENLTTKRDKQFDEITTAMHKLRADNDRQQFVDTINLIFKKENDEITSNCVTNLIKGAISEVTKTRDQETFDRCKEVFNQLTPILTKLGFSNLQANSAWIVKGIATRLSENKSWFTWSTTPVTLSPKNCQKISDQLSNLGEAQETDSLISEAQVSDPLIKKIMDHLITEKKLNISLDLKGKMSKILLVGISKLDPEYRKVNEDILAENMSKNINNKGTVLPNNHHQFSIDNITLATIVKEACDKISSPNLSHIEVIPIKEQMKDKISFEGEVSSINSARSTTKPCPGKEQSNNFSEKKQGMGMK